MSDTPDLLRRAADLIEDTSAATPDGHLDAWRKPDVRAALIPWVALMGPGIATPLAAWLRAEADIVDTLPDTVEAFANLGTALEEAATGIAGKPWTARVTLRTDDKALAFARTIIGDAL